MAGSYQHLIGEDGVFTMDYIDNMGDAAEALEECFIMISQLQDTVLRLQSAESPKPTYNSASDAITLRKRFNNIVSHYLGDVDEPRNFMVTELINAVLA